MPPFPPGLRDLRAVFGAGVERELFDVIGEPFQQLALQAEQGAVLGVEPPDQRAGILAIGPHGEGLGGRQPHLARRVIQCLFQRGAHQRIFRTGERLERQQRNGRIRVGQGVGERILRFHAAFADQIVHRKQAQRGIRMGQRDLGRVGNVTKLARLEGAHPIQRAPLAVAQRQAVQRAVQRIDGSGGVAPQLGHAGHPFPVAARALGLVRRFGERLVAVGGGEEGALGGFQLGEQDLSPFGGARIRPQRERLPTRGAGIARLAQGGGHSEATQPVPRIEGCHPLAYGHGALPILDLHRFLPGQAQRRFVQPGRERARLVLNRRPTAGQRRGSESEEQTRREEAHAQPYPSRPAPARCMKKPYAIGCGLALLVLIGAIIGLIVYLNRAFQTEPEEVRATAAEILAIEAPADLEPRLALKLLGAKVAIFQGADERNSLVMAAIPQDAIEDSAAEWNAQTQIEWAKFDANAEIEESQLELLFAGQPIQVELAVVQTQTATYRSFLATIPRSDGEIKLFRVGEAQTVTVEHFQDLLDQASAGL